MIAFLFSLAISAAVLCIVDWLYEGLQVDGFGTAMIASLVYGLFAALLVPVASTSAPAALIHFLAAGLALWLSAAVLPGFRVNGFGGALVSALLIGLVEMLFGTNLF